MRLLAVTLFSGVLLFQQLPSLPEAPWLWPLIISSLFYRFLKPLRPLAGVALGFFLAFAHAEWRLEPGFDPALEGQDLRITGQIAELPQQRGRLTRLVVAVEEASHDGRVVTSPRRIRVNWYRPDAPVHVGERWAFTVRLKRPRGFLNPGGFDYAGWLYSRGIQATGYIRGQPAPQRLSRAPPGIDRWRGSIVSAIDATLDEQAAVITALTVGERGGITPGQWDALRRTGTSHLLAISGLHVGLISGLVLMGVRGAWRRSASACRLMAAPRAGAIAGLLAAVVYAALAGFSLPTQRALIMLAAVMGAVILGRALSVGQGLAVAMVGVLVWDPTAVLSPGFWLSFGAVAWILYVLSARLGRTGRLAGYARLQAALAVGLAPVLLWYFQDAPLAGPVANALMVPWIGLVVVPLSLAGAIGIGVVAPLGEACLHLAQLAVTPVWWFLDSLSGQSWITWNQHRPAFWTVPLAGLGVLLLLAPRAWPGRLPGIALAAPLFLVTPARPEPGEAWLNLLDVGQGLSMVVETRSHVLVFDTGPRYSPTFDAGSAVVLPFLRTRAVDAVDMLVVSHGDSDHSGGMEALLEGFEIRSLRAGEGVDGPWPPCRSGERWTWDGVRFEFLHPAPGGNGGENDNSCVLRIATEGASALLLADLERAGEHELTERAGAQLRSDIMIVPHHGSTSSSHGFFLDAVSPRYALVSAGYRNRWGFPRAEVLARYAERGVTVLDTVESGALKLTLDAGGVSTGPGWRQSARRYWHVTSLL